LAVDAGGFGADDEVVGGAEVVVAGLSGDPLVAWVVAAEVDVGEGAAVLAGGLQADKANADSVATDKTAKAALFLLGWG
jgi:hypothetical protein